MSTEFSSADAERIAASLAEPISPRYVDVRARQLEGTYPGDPMQGVWPISAARILYGWGAVSNKDWPYDADHGVWPPVEPPGMDEKAKPRRIPGYQRVRTAGECCAMLGHAIPVCVALEITEQWFNAERGAISVPAATDKIVGSHLVTFIGFDLALGVFRFENSWGDSWGDRGFGYLPIGYFNRHLVSAWAYRRSTRPPPGVQPNVVQQLVRDDPDFLGHSSLGGDVFHVREVYDSANDERMGWAFAVHRAGWLDVEELFVRPAYRRRGVGQQLVDLLLELSNEAQQPIRLWIRFADWTETNLPAVQKIAEKLELQSCAPETRWAAAVAVSPTATPRPATGNGPQGATTDHAVTDVFAPRSATFPQRPALLGPARSSAMAAAQTPKYPLHGSPIRYDEPTEPVAGADWESLR